MLWDWGWTWKSLDIAGSQYGIKVSGAYIGGSILVLDSKITNTAIGIYVNTPKGASTQEHMSITLDNLVLEAVGTAVSDPVAGTSLAGGTKTVVSWVQGRVYDPTHGTGFYKAGDSLSPVRPKIESLMGGPNGGYFERSKEQYVSDTPQDFVSAKIIAKGIDQP